MLALIIEKSKRNPDLSKVKTILILLIGSDKVISPKRAIGL